jgi:hypothetical protein
VGGLTLPDPVSKKPSDLIWFGLSLLVYGFATYQFANSLYVSRKCPPGIEECGKTPGILSYLVYIAGAALIFITIARFAGFRREP